MLVSTFIRYSWMLEKTYQFTTFKPPPSLGNEDCRASCNSMLYVKAEEKVYWRPNVKTHHFTPMSEQVSKHLHPKPMNQVQSSQTCNCMAWSLERCKSRHPFVIIQEETKYCFMGSFPDSYGFPAQLSRMPKIISHKRYHCLLSDAQQAVSCL